MAGDGASMIQASDCCGKKNTGMEQAQAFRRTHHKEFWRSGTNNDGVVLGGMTAASCMGSPDEKQNEELDDKEASSSSSGSVRHDAKLGR